MDTTKGKVIKCKAAVAWEPNQPMVIEEVEVAPPKANEIRVKILATGACHSDLSAWKGLLPFTRFPTILGHEASGIVESIGEGVTDVKEGDYILPSFLPHCGECQMCKSEDTNLCMKFLTPPDAIGFLSDGTTRFTCKGKPIHYFVACSTYSEYTVLPAGSYVKINKAAPMDKVCILSCGITTGFGGPVKVAKVKPGSTCAVFGLGSVGLAAVMGCKFQGAKTIFGIDINNGKKDYATTFGVTDFLNPKDYDKPIEKILEEKTQGGCDYTFECIGNPEVMMSAFNSCHVGGGQCVVIGVPPAGKNLAVDPYQLLFGKELTGCFLGGYTNLDTPALVEDYMNKKIMVDEFITHTLPFDEINKAFDYMVEGKSVKTVLKF